MELGVDAIGSKQLRMRTDFRNASLIEHNDSMRINDRRQAVCYNDCGAILQYVVDSL